LERNKAYITVKSKLMAVIKTKTPIRIRRKVDHEPIKFCPSGIRGPLKNVEKKREPPAVRCEKGFKRGH
jgi:hypothetical protein